MSDNLPRVSTILKLIDDSYSCVPAHVLDFAAQRGTELHRLCLQHLASMIGLCSIPDDIPAEYSQVYLGFLEWIEKKKVIPELIEEQSSNKTYGFRGTPDLLCRTGSKGELVLPDLKFTDKILPMNKVQIRAYWELDGYRDAKKACLVHIDWKTGKWTEHHLYKNGGGEWPVFLSGLQIWRWRNKGEAA